MRPPTCRRSRRCIRPTWPGTRRISEPAPPAGAVRIRRRRPRTRRRCRRQSGRERATAAHRDSPRSAHARAEGIQEALRRAIHPARGKTSAALVLPVFENRPAKPRLAHRQTEARRRKTQHAQTQRGDRAPRTRCHSLHALPAGGIVVAPESERAISAATVGAGDRLRCTRVVGAPPRGSLLRGERRSCLQARRSRGSARADHRHRHSGDAAVQRAARSRDLRGRARARRQTNSPC